MAEVTMKGLLIGALLVLCAGNAFAAESCTNQAASRHLAGAALTSFMAKCQKDAQTSCDASAASQKLSGAAKTSFTKKCLGDAVGQGK
jgi:hypothetical protein